MRPELIAAVVLCSGCATPVVGFVPLTGQTWPVSARAVEVPDAADLAPIGWVYSSEKEGTPAAVKQRAMECAAGAGADQVVFTDVSDRETETSMFSGSSSLGMLSGTTPMTMYSGTVTDSKEVTVTRFIGKVYRRGVSAVPAPPVARPYLARLAQARIACPRGEAEGCGALRSATESGRVRGLDPDEALAAHERACADGNPFGCEVAGWQYASGLWAAPKDLDRAVQLLRRGCALGSASSCSNLASLVGGPDRAQLVARADALRAQWCAAGELMSCGGLGTGELEIAKATELCHSGRIEHCFLAASGLTGEARVAWMKRLCSDGDARACGAAAPDVPRDEGLKLAAEACGLGDCRSLHRMLRAP